MAIKYADLDRLNSSLDSLSNTLLRNRALDQEQGRFNAQQGMEQQRIDLSKSGQQSEQAYRDAMLKENMARTAAAQDPNTPKNLKLQADTDAANRKNTPTLSYTDQNGVAHKNIPATDKDYFTANPPMEKGGIVHIKATRYDENGSPQTADFQMDNTHPDKKAASVAALSEWSSGGKPKPVKPTGQFSTAIKDYEDTKAQLAATDDPEEKARLAQHLAIDEGYLKKASTRPPPNAGTQTVKQIPDPLNPGKLLSTTNTTTPLNFSGGAPATAQPAPAAGATPGPTRMKMYRWPDGSLNPTPPATAP